MLKVKLAVISVLPIAFLPNYAIANITTNSAPGWTQLSSQVIADQLTQVPNTGGTEDTTIPGGTLAQPRSNSPDPDTGTPEGERTPGGTRGGACKQTDKPFTALVPENAKGLTSAEHPVFWFYIPDAAEDIDSIEFSLHDKNDKTTLYRTSLQVSKTPGVIGIPLPPNPEYSLKLNESYQWRFIVNCTQKETPEYDPAMEGWITRVQPGPNLWYDELTTLAQRYRSEPQNPELKKAWIELLKSVGLEGIAQAPLIDAASNPQNGASSATR